VVDPQKYIVFKREEFYQLMGDLALPPYFPIPGSDEGAVGMDWDCAPIAEYIQAKAEATEIEDAVVIRRQDAFAPPALDAYANGIRLATSLAPQNGLTKELNAKADYFHEQAVLSWDAVRKLPD
jgi:hypothetical protein